MNLFMYGVDKYKDENEVYGIIYSDYPDSLLNSDFKDELVDNYFNNAIACAVSNIKGNKVSEKKIAYHSYPGREIKISFSDGNAIMYMQMFLVKNRAYMLEVGCETKNDNNKDITNFFNSFSLLTDGEVKK